MSSSPYLEQAIRQGETLLRYLNLQLKTADELPADDRKDVTMSLDDTLREILDFRKGTTDDRIAQIKAAFQEAGWIDTNKPITGPIHGVGVYEVDMHMMSGQTWYDRFITEAKRELGYTDDQVGVIFRGYAEAARRAANLEDTE